MKKILLILLLSLGSISASAYEIIEVDGIYYEIYGSSVSVTSYDANNYSGEVNIPNDIIYQGITYPVTSIGNNAFCECSNLTSVTIPNSVTSIEYYAFYECSNLKSITIPNSVIYIGKSAFESCSALKTVTISNSLTFIEPFTFYKCSNLTSVKIPNTVTSIGDRAFYGCTNLTSVKIPDSVTLIGYEAFYDCKSLNTVTIPNSVISIGDQVFDGTALYNNESNWKDDALYINNHLISVKKNLSGEYVIRNGTITLAGKAFFGCSKLTSVTIPDSVISIGNRAFSRCASLTSVTIPSSVKLIGTSIFYETPIYDDESNWESDVLYIDHHLICTKNNISGEYIIKNGTITLASGAFYGCSELTAVTIPNSVTSIGDGTFYDCTSLTSVNIPNSVTSIGEEAFNGCKAMTTVTISNAITSISKSTFCGCEQLISVTIPNSVTFIGANAFYHCERLNELNIGNSVASIGQAAFGECRSMTKIYTSATTPPKCYGQAFKYVDRSICTLFVPRGSANYYRVSWPWSGFNIEEHDFLGIEAIVPEQDDNSSYNVYDLSGVLRMITPNQSDIKNLPSGIYVINGKKVMVR